MFIENISSVKLYGRNAPVFARGAGEKVVVKKL
jgi:hypothetical protein